MDKSQNKKIIAEINKLYQEYIAGMNKLKEEQNQLIKKYINKLEEKKKEELRKSISNS